MTIGRYDKKLPKVMKDEKVLETHRKLKFVLPTLQIAQTCDGPTDVLDKVAYRMITRPDTRHKMRLVRV